MSDEWRVTSGEWLVTSDERSELVRSGPPCEWGNTPLRDALVSLLVAFAFVVRVQVRIFVCEAISPESI